MFSLAGHGQEGKPNGKLRSRDCDETTEGSDDDLVTRSSSMKTAASSYSQETRGLLTILRAKRKSEP